MKNSKYKYLLLDLLFLLGIIVVIYIFVDFKFGHYLFTGDFRFSINQEVFGDQALSLISKKFSNNNFVFLPFYSLYLLLQFLPYHYLLLYIFFGIPALLFLSMRYVLLKTASLVSPSHHLGLYFFVSSLSFYFAINPSLFTRFGHWPILHGAIFFPLYLYFLHQYLKSDTFFSKAFWLLPVVLFLGAATPQLVIVYFTATVLDYFLIYFFCRKDLKLYFIQGSLIFIAALISFLHIIYPTFMGYAKTKSPLESATTANILSSLAKNSNLISAVSGTNYYHELVKYPTQISVGLFIFMLTILFVLINKKLGGLKMSLFLVTLIGLVIITGHNSFGFIFDFLNQTFISDFIWIVKDPNMYYLFFLVPVLILLSKLAAEIQVGVSKTYLLYLSALFIVGFNLLFTFSSNKKEYNLFYHFVKLPSEYFALAEDLEEDEARNLWLPAGVYVNKNFSSELTYFPSPSLWLTKNRELAESTVEYKKLIDLIEGEIFKNDCQNTNFLNWVIAAQNLNVIIDKNSVDYQPSLGAESVELKIKLSQECLRRLDNIYLYNSFGQIDVYKSNLNLKNELYRFFGRPDGLDGFLKDNPANIIFEESDQNKAERVNSDYSILNESYDENWLDLNNRSAKAKVNLASMLFEDDQSFHYRGEPEFQKVVTIQKILLAFLLLIFIYQSLANYVRKKCL